MAHPFIRVVAALITRSATTASAEAPPKQQYLVTQRRATAVLPLKWEFPGGKVEPGESDQAALRRELHVRLGTEVVVGQSISQVRHDYQSYSVELCLYEAVLQPGAEPRAVSVQDFRWVTSDELDELEFTPADEASLARLLGIKLRPVN